jgi:hypothetical protein
MYRGFCGKVLRRHKLAKIRKYGSINRGRQFEGFLQIRLRAP